MPATLPQIQARLDQAIALRDDALDALPAIVAAGGASTAEVRTKHVARLQGYQREVELLQKIERDLISQGRAAENDLLKLSRFNAPPPASAAVTPLDATDAPTAPREAPRNEASATPLPASGDVF